ncbi:hypothetical protein [Bradyrhizobium sp. CCGUVB14]|uniref:hypothetical protein n=1 Tax=Bradyrhizobium sp. CCGUVB14 TaxID=2949628 RepID=UPI0020B2768F|nr:hypothetical protein [Bradyrhizobium sp. CCGUVB14]MCP3440389.1 hypothetical protein [Bradyrhizobium sp. CCGUVB14]
MKITAQVALMIMGIAVIVVGVVLMFRHQSQEAMFQDHLLAVFNTDYHWRSIGDAYSGIAAVAVGAVMMAVSALAAR